jgi:cytosine deaminase
VPEPPPLTIRSARLLDRDEPVDVVLADGAIRSIDAAGRAAVEGEAIEADGGLLTPSFVDPHFHADKALTFPRVGPLDDPSLDAVIERCTRIKSQYTHEDVVARATSALELAVGHGVGRVRAQVDVDHVSGLVGLEALLEVRRRFEGIVDLQLVAFPQYSILEDGGRGEELLREAMARGADVLGGAPDVEEPADRARHIERLFAIAGELDVDLDVHVDFSDDPEQRDLGAVARKTLEAGRVGRVTAVHCCALEAVPDAQAAEDIAAVRAAGVQVCICPVGNMQLIGDAERMPRGRGTARMRELLAAGVNVAAGSDNLHDMWFRFGRMDPLDTALMACLAARMRTDAEVREAFDLVTVRAARFMSAPGGVVREAAPADLVLFSAQTLDDVLRRAPGRRTTIKRGRVVGGSEATAWMVPPG